MKYILFCEIFFRKSFLSSVWEHLEEFGLATVAKWLKLSPGRCRLSHNFISTNTTKNIFLFGMRETLQDLAELRVSL